jgi:hypothetical protein
VPEALTQHHDAYAGFQKMACVGMPERVKVEPFRFRGQRGNVGIWAQWRGAPGAWEWCLTICGPPVPEALTQHLDVYAGFQKMACVGMPEP